MQMSSTHWENVTLDVLVTCVYFLLHTFFQKKGKRRPFEYEQIYQKGFLTKQDMNPIPLSADWTLIEAVLEDADADDDADAVWWCESCRDECLPSIEWLLLSDEVPSLSFDFDFSLNFDDIRSLSACMTDCMQQWQSQEKLFIRTVSHFYKDTFLWICVTLSFLVAYG